MKNDVPEFVVCREKPTVIEVSDGYIVVYCRDSHLTLLFVEETKRICELVVAKPQVAEPEIPPDAEEQDDEECPSDVAPKWKLPEDKDSPIFEYYGKPVKFAKTRLGVMRELIRANGKSVSYSEIIRLCDKTGSILWYRV